MQYTHNTEPSTHNTQTHTCPPNQAFPPHAIYTDKANTLFSSSFIIIIKFPKSRTTPRAIYALHHSDAHLHIRKTGCNVLIYSPRKGVDGQGGRGWSLHCLCKKDPPDDKKMDMIMHAPSFTFFINSCFYFVFPCVYSFFALPFFSFLCCTCFFSGYLHTRLFSCCT